MAAFLRWLAMLKIFFLYVLLICMPLWAVDVAVFHYLVFGLLLQSFWICTMCHTQGLQYFVLPYRLLSFWLLFSLLFRNFSVSHNAIRLLLFVFFYASVVYPKTRQKQQQWKKTFALLCPETCFSTWTISPGPVAPPVETVLLHLHLLYWSWF